MIDNRGVLYIVSTPIGNLEDITIRALKVLRGADAILCEDTSISKKLLFRYKIKKPLVSYYKPRERQKLDLILGMLSQKKKIALISDAGTPVISDPGWILVSEARRHGHTVIGIPGPSSVTTALSISGFNAERFIFEGFLPKKKRDLKERLVLLKNLPHTLVFFVPARQLFETLFLMNEEFGDRKVCVAKELTKLYEEAKIDTIVNFISHSGLFKGEITLIVEGASVQPEIIDTDKIRGEIKKNIALGRTFKDILKDDIFKKMKRNELYDIYEELKHDKGRAEKEDC